MELEPEHAYVLDDGERAVGYVIGTPSTPDFVAAYRREWLPRMRRRYEAPGEPPGEAHAAAPVTAERQKLDDMFHPERMLLPELAPHPAHLHVDLLPGYQRGGHGRAMVGTFLASVAAAGARSCHLMVRPGNTGALRFYAKTGWQRLEVDSPGDWIVLTRPTTPAA